jgi:hypothetical protein
LIALVFRLHETILEHHPWTSNKAKPYTRQ